MMLKREDYRPTSTLLQWGEPGASGVPEAPGVLSDIFARVGGPDIDRSIGAAPEFGA